MSCRFNNIQPNSANRVLSADFVGQSSPYAGFHFEVGHYLRHFTAELILSALDAYLSSSAFAFKFDGPSHIPYHIVNTSFESFNHTLVINGQEELTYLQLGQGLLVAYHRRTSKSSDQQQQPVGRCYLFPCGNTIYNTERALAVNIHYQDIQEPKNQQKSINMGDKLGLDSNFQQQQDFGKYYNMNSMIFRYDDINIDIKLTTSSATIDAYSKSSRTSMFSIKLKAHPSSTS